MQCEWKSLKNLPDYLHNAIHFELPIAEKLNCFGKKHYVVVSIGKWSSASEIYVEDVIMSFWKNCRGIVNMSY